MGIRQKQPFRFEGAREPGALYDIKVIHLVRGTNPSLHMRTGRRPGSSPSSLGVDFSKSRLLMVVR